MFKQIAVSFFVFAVAIVIGGVTASHSWKGAMYLGDGTLVNSNSRNPAAIRHDLDFSRLEGAELVTATQKRLVTAARVILRDGLVGVELGHFVTRDSKGQKRLACDMLYNRLHLRFEANGVASGGEKPVMEVDGPCLTSNQDISAIEPIWIPVREILKTQATNEDLDFNDGVQFKFLNMSGDWPVSWSLESVRLYDQESTAQEVKISAQELHELREKPFVINWFEASRVPSAIGQ